MLLLSLDPSSTALGWCAAWVNPDLNQFKIDSSGVIKPPRAMKAVLRVDLIADQVRDYLAKCRASFPYEEIVVVIETTSGKVNRSRHSGGGAGLSTYGDAVGSIRTACRIMDGIEVVNVPENQWTGGHSKDKRKRAAARHVPGYDQRKDGGGDQADAICLAM